MASFNFNCASKTKHFSSSSRRLVATVLFAAVLLPLQALAAETGEYDKAVEMSMDYRYGQAVPLLRQAAINGDQRAQLTLALMLYHGQTMYGEEVHQDRAEAGHWFRCAAAKGSSVSHQYLIRHYASSTTEVLATAVCP